MMQHDNDNLPAVATRNGPANDNHKAQPLRFLSVCSGIEAASVAWPQWEAVGYAEIEPFPAFVLHHHYGAGRPKFMPDPGENQLKKKDKNARLAAIRSVSNLPVDGNVTNWGDFTKIDTTTLGRVDVLCGGTPCQAFSVAGLRGGLDDARGNLTLKFVELAHALAAGNGLRNIVWENVVGVLSDKGNAFGCFLGGLVGADAAVLPSDKPADGKSNKHWRWCKKRGTHSLTWPNAGLVSGPKGRAAWRICDAQYWGVAQRRRRVIVVADFGNGADPAEVLFEREGVQRHTPPSREARKGTARGFEVGPGGGGFTELAPTLDCRAKNGPVQNQIGAGVVHAPEIARCVATREGSSQDYETTTMVAVGVHGQVAHTLKAEGADASEDGTGRGTPIVAQTVALRGRDGGATAELGGEVATALRASQGGGDKQHVLAFNTSGYGAAVDSDVASTMQASYDRLSNQVYGAVVNSAVRRLTPVECERLQGFPDGYTAIPWRGKPASECPDGPRYKALGNSWAVPLFAWLGRRIDKHMPPIAANDNQEQRFDAAA